MGNALSNLFPTGWLDPYGQMPLNEGHSVQIDITQVETDDGIRVTAVKTPPRAGTTSIQDAISMALGMGCDEIGPYSGSQRSADLGKRETDSSSENTGKKPGSTGKQGGKEFPPEKKQEGEKEEDPE